MSENIREYFLTTKANSYEQQIHEKQELEAKNNENRILNIYK